MKARVWFLTLLVCMISLVGFGNTTADLSQNTERDVGIGLMLNITSVNVVMPDVLYLGMQSTSVNVVSTIEPPGIDYGEFKNAEQHRNYFKDKITSRTYLIHNRARDSLQYRY